MKKNPYLRSMLVILFVLSIAMCMVLGVSGVAFADKWTLTLTEVPSTAYTLTMNPTGNPPGRHNAGDVVTVDYAGTDANYVFVDWSDGTGVLSTTSPYTFTMPNSSYTLYANFGHAISATAGANGSISPSGGVKVRHGYDQTFTITPDVNAEIVDVEVDGESVGALTQYTFNNVTTDHTIHATFAVLPGTISGTVTAEVGGAALPGITVYVWDSTTNLLTDETATDVSGAYTLDVPDGTYKVQFMDLSGVYATEWYDDQPRRAIATSVSITAGGTEALDAALALGGTIAGTLTAQGGGGISDIRINVYDGVTDAFTNRWTFTDGSGAYSLLLPVGSYKVRFVDEGGIYRNEWYDDSYTMPEEANVIVTAGATETLDAVLTSTGTISGTVIAEGGGGLSGIRVYVYDGTNAWTGVKTTTSASGAYIIGNLPAGSYKVRFVDESGTYRNEFYDDSYTWPPTANVIVTAGDTTTLDAALTPVGTISGTVTAEVGGAPLAGIRVYLYDGANAWTGIKATTGASGAYIIGNLPAGSYKVYFVDRNGVYRNEFYDNSYTWPPTANVIVTAGDTTTLDAALEAY